MSKPRIRAIRVQGFPYVWAKQGRKCLRADWFPAGTPLHVALKRFCDRYNVS